MQRHFDEDLNKLNTDLLRMATLTEEAISKATEALRTRNKELALNVAEQDNAIDELDLKIEEQAIDLLALYQPMAVDLRFITMAMYINAELERIADLAVNIAYRVVDLADQPLLKPVEEIPRLSDIARKMVKNSIDSFVKKDEVLAKAVIISDKESDNLRNIIMKELINDYMVKDGKTAPRAVSLLLVARDLERICDHATNIAEDVIYMIEARFVKHHKEKLDRE